MIYTKLAFLPDLYSHDTRVLYTCTRVCSASVYVRASTDLYLLHLGRSIMRRAKVALFITRIIIIVIILYVILLYVRVRTRPRKWRRLHMPARPKEFGVRCF